MAWQALWRKEHHVDPYVVARAGEARAQHFGSRSDAAQAILVDGEVEVGGAVAPFDLDEGDRAPAPRDKVDLADGDAEPLAQDAPAMEAEPPCGTALGLAATRFGGGAIQACSFSASARA
jgi:hypothetical protein